MKPAHPAFLPLSLVLGVLAISSGGVLAVLAGDVAPAVIGFWRVSICGVLLAPALLRAPRPARRDLLIIGLAGLCLALHFWTWIASLQRISVMRSVVLVTLAPLWVGLMEWKSEGKIPQRLFWLGVGVALLGVLGLGAASEDGLLRGDPTGDALAVLGGMLSSAYLVIGRSVRQRVGFLSYGALVCLSAAPWLLGMVWVSQGAELQLLGHDGATWLALVALALGPQLLGHVSLSFAVRYVKASVIATLILLEPVGATLLGALVLGEIPGRGELLAGTVILLGVALASRAEKQP